MPIGDDSAVTLADLYAEGFDPVLSARDFTDRTIPERLQPMDEQLHAADGGTFAPNFARHVELFTAAGLLILVSPMWWFSVSAIMKGWMDRVFATASPTATPTSRPGPAFSARSGECS